MANFGQPWTEAQIEFVKAHVGKLNHHEIATALGRSRSSVKNFCRLNGLKRPPAWSDADRAFVISKLEIWTHQQIADALGRSRHAVHNFCTLNRLTSTRRKRWTQTELSIIYEGVRDGLTSAQILQKLPGRTLPMVNRQRELLGLVRRKNLDGLDELIREKHSQQWCDNEIAEEWNRRQVDPQSRITRTSVSDHRRKLKLPAQGMTTDRFRARVAATTRAQLNAAGLKSLADLKAGVIAGRITGLGWPADLRWREAQILTLIWERGPMTKRELADAVGDRRGILHSNDREGGGSYMSSLMRRGLLIVFKRAVKVPGYPHRAVDLYCLNPQTIKRRKVDIDAGTQRHKAHQADRGRSRGPNPDGAAAVA